MNISKFILMLSFVSSGAISEEWNCRNDFESSCSQMGCVVFQGESFTPADVRIKSNGELLICKYSGCWEGKGQVLSKSPFLVVFGKQLKWNNPYQPEYIDALISLKLTSNVAVLQVAGFHEPLICKKANRK